MNIRHVIYIVCFSMVTGIPFSQADQVNDANMTTFQPDTTAKSSEVNANFSELKRAINNNNANITDLGQDIADNGMHITDLGQDVADNVSEIASKQNRVTESCAQGSIKKINEDGTIECRITKALVTFNDAVRRDRIIMLFRPDDYSNPSDVPVEIRPILSGCTGSDVVIGYTESSHILGINILALPLPLPLPAPNYNVVNIEPTGSKFSYRIVDTLFTRPDFPEIWRMGIYRDGAHAEDLCTGAVTFYGVRIIYPTGVGTSKTLFVSPNTMARQ